MKDSLVATKLNWIPFDYLKEPITCQAKIRSTQKPTDVIVTPLENGNILVKFDDMQKSIAIGQSVVFYDGERVLGGGIIDA